MVFNKKSLLLINYILSKTGECDKIKLNKLLYFIDFENYLLFKKSISDFSYYHIQHGPVPNLKYSEIYDQAEKKGYLERKWKL